jgi:cysteine desulfurase
LAIVGLGDYLHKKEKRPYEEMEVVTTRIEHPSILSLCEVLAAKGVVVKFVEVDKEGKISVLALESVLSLKTVLTTFAYANSEIGAVQSVSRLMRVVRRFEKENDIRIFTHLDSAQAPLWLSCKFDQLGIDMMSLDVGKCCGPKGLGILAKRDDVHLVSILHGGGQEQSLRPGTENVPSIVGAARALEIAQVNYKKRAEKVALIRDDFFKKINEVLPTAVINGPRGESRLANNINISLPGFDTEYAVVYLDTNGIAASTKSACAGAGSGESTVVLAITGDSNLAKSTIRFSLGEETTKVDLVKVSEVLIKFQQKMSDLTQ